MNYKHLFWIIPTCIIVGLALGYIIGVNDAMWYVGQDAGVEKLCKLMLGVN